jgi:hypothetical protein
MSRDICQLCRGIRHCPRYQAKWPSETSPGAIFMPFWNGFGNISDANHPDLCSPGSQVRPLGPTSGRFPTTTA